MFERGMETLLPLAFLLVGAYMYANIVVGIIFRD